MELQKLDKSVLKLWYIRAAIISLALIGVFTSAFTILNAAGAPYNVTLAVLPALNVTASVISAVALSVAGAGIIVLIVKMVSAVLSYQTNGVAINNGKITAYCGGFTRNITVFMAKNLIAAEDITTPLRKKAGITSLVMHLKTNALSNEVKVHIQKDTLSEELEELLIL